MQDTWYILEDGTSADPNEVAPDENGILRHRDGLAVAIGTHGNYRSRGVDPEEERAKAKKAQSKKDMKPEEPKPDDQKSGYKTRESKAD